MKELAKLKFQSPNPLARAESEGKHVSTAPGPCLNAYMKAGDSWSDFAGDVETSAPRYENEKGWDEGKGGRKEGKGY